MSKETPTLTFCRVRSNGFGGTEESMSTENHGDPESVYVYCWAVD